MDAAALVYQGLVGLSLAMSLWLVAAGLTLTFGVLGILNFAHGSLYMLGAYLGYMFYGSPLYGSLGLSFWLSVPLAALSVGVLGVVMERIFFRPLYHLNEAYFLILTFGFVLIFSDVVRILWGGVFLIPALPPGLTGSVRVLGRGFPVYDLFQMGAGVVIAVALWLLLDHTWWGRIVRATASDREMASTLGVHTGCVFALVSGLAAMVAGLGGALSMPQQVVTSGLGTAIIIEAFIITVIGGLGNLRGAFIAALIVGLANAYVALLFPAASLFLIYLIMVFILLLRPQGLFRGR